MIHEYLISKSCENESLKRQKIEKPEKNIDEILGEIRSDIVGQYAKFSTPFGEKPIVYADWTATGKSLEKIESFLIEEMIPIYGNTHTSSSLTGQQTTCYRNEARQIIAESVNAKITGKAADDIVLFIGNGTTGAIYKLIELLGFNIPISDEIEDELKPVVFVSSFEHHSNLVPWRESAASAVVQIKYDPKTGVCLKDLEEKLIQFKNKRVKIGSFSAASNITGICTDVNSVSILMHKYEGLAFFDYASGAPYLKMDMNPYLPNNDFSDLAYKDGIFFSGHKFVGGPGCPGVLIIKKRLMPSSIEPPSDLGGGGTVFYVTEKGHRYTPNMEEREEAGTPQIVGDVKLGLALQVKQSVGTTWIEEEEYKVSAYVHDKLQHRNIILLGRDFRDSRGISSATPGKYLPTFSFLILCNGRYLHYNFVCSLLNDLFGVQSRGGCMCAGPYAQMLLGIDDDLNDAYQISLLDKHEVFRPGVTRLSFPFWMKQSEIDYITDAIIFVAENGWMYLPNYSYNHKTGEWAHLHRLTRFPERKWLSNFSMVNYKDRLSIYNKLDKLEKSEQDYTVYQKSSQLSKYLFEWKLGSVEDLFEKIFHDVNEETENLKSIYQNAKEKNKPAFNASNSYNEPNDANIGDIEGLRWFVLPEEICRPDFDSNSPIYKSPFEPYGFKLSQEASNKHTIQMHLSKYSELRDKLIPFRDGKTKRVPRYLHAILLKESNKPNKIFFSKTIDDDNLLELHDGYFECGVSGNLPPQTEQDTNASQCPCLVATNRKIEIPGEQSNIEIIDKDGKALSGPGTTFWPEDDKLKLNNVKVPPKKLMKLVGQAILDWNMIEEGDKLLLGLSGGKDSLALLHILIAFQKRSPVKFELSCATVDPQTASFDPSALIPYVQSLGITYHYLSEPIVELAKSKLQGDSLCAFCSRFKRGLLYSCCRNFKYNKLVLAQHLDDLVESFMMSALHNGQIRTMKANYKIDAGDIRVIRPLIYVRENFTRDFSQSSKLPIINENCPACFEQPKERARMKKLLLQEEAMVPALFFNMKRALMPLLHEETYKYINKVADDIEKRSQALKKRLPKDSNNLNNSDHDKK